jgi:hypothetical protein
MENQEESMKGVESKVSSTNFSVEVESKVDQFVGKMLE